MPHVYLLFKIAFIINDIFHFDLYILITLAVIIKSVGESLFVTMNEKTKRNCCTISYILNNKTA